MPESLFENIAWQVGQAAALRNPATAKAAPYFSAARKLRNGDVGGALLGALDVALSSSGKPPLAIQAQASVPDGKSRLYGGVTLAKAREIFKKHSAINFAKANLWFIRISDLSDNGGIMADFNMFATNVSYAPITISSEAMRAGSGSFDVVQGSERVSMRVTTLDDEDGTIKKWFSDRGSRVCHADGTYGLPVDYLLRVEVYHAHITDEAPSAYFDEYLMRPAGIEYDLSRRDDALQELQLSFEQFDTFATLS